MYTSCNKDKDKDEGTTLDSKLSTPDSPNTGQIIDSDDETKRAEKLLEDYYKAKIDHNDPIFHMIQKIVREERRSLSAIINLFNKSKLPYPSTNHLFIVKVVGAEIRQIAEKSTLKVNNAKPTKTKSTLHKKIIFKDAVSLPPHSLFHIYHTVSHSI